MTNHTVTDTAHDPINILAITGSLRDGSVNRGAVRAAVELAAPGVTVTEADLNDIPLYSEDTQAEGMPEAVLRLHWRARFRRLRRSHAAEKIRRKRRRIPPRLTLRPGRGV